MKIYLVRHGETDWNLQGIIQGKTDIALNETGIAQAYQTKELLKGIEFDCVYCSPLKRAQQTASIIFENQKVPIILDNRISERDFGQYESVNVKELDFKSFWNLHNVTTTRNEEPAPAFFERVNSFLDDIIKLDYNNVIIVAHGGVSLPIYSYFCDLKEENDYIKYMLKNCEVACYDTIKKVKCEI